MMRGIFVLSVSLCAMTVLADGPADDRALIAQAAADRQAQPAPPVGAADKSTPDPEERQAQADLILAQARVDLLAARRELRAQRWQAATERAQGVLAALKRLPADVDGSELELVAEGVVARAGKSNTGGDSRVLAAQPSSAAVEAARAPLDQQSRNAAGIARAYEGTAHPDVDNTASVDDLRARALQRQNADRWGYRPAREIVDRDSAEDRSRQNLSYQPQLQQVIAADEQQRLTHADEARVAGEVGVVYPRDWAAKTAARAMYKDRPLAQSAAHNDQNGRQWSTAVYDISDLTEIPPDFYMPLYALDPFTSYLLAADRQALRDRSNIFSGYAGDLAAGLPLLDYFGGNGNLDARPRYSPERQAQIVEMIKSFELRDVEPRVISLPAVR